MKSKYIFYLIKKLVQNYILIRGCKALVADYNHWKAFHDYSNIKVLTLGDISYISPYINATYALECLKLRGGQGERPILIALYKILRIIEHHLTSRIPIHKLPYMSKYIAARESDPRLKRIEEFLAWITLSLVGARSYFISTYGNQTNTTFIPIDIPLNYEEFTKQFEIHDSVCDNKLTSIYSMLTDEKLSHESKVTLFELFARYLVTTSNSGLQQALLLCLIALLLFILLYDPILFKLIIKMLERLVDEGHIKRSILDLIYRGISKKARIMGITEPNFDDLIPLKE